VFNWDAVDELFPPGVLDGMFAAYTALLDELAEGEDAWHRAPHALLPSGQAAARRRANATHVALDDDLLHAPFERRALEAPERTALVSAERSFTYGELHRLASRLGRTLRALDARPNELVAVVAEKGWEQVAGVLGVLASGAAYVPIDPELPALRLAQLLAASEARIVVTEGATAGRVAWPDGVRVVCVDRDDDLAADGEPLEPRQRPEDLAYVIYTSGSTGVPKGVMIDHRGAANTIHDVNRRFAVGPGDAVLALSSLSFDLSVYDVFGLLAAGGTVVVPAPGAARDPAHWRERIASYGVTIWNSVPALLQMLVESVAGTGASLPPSLRLAMLSGDWIPVALPDRLRVLAPGIEVVSLGGATEASIWSIAYPIGEVDPAWPSIPYGRALANQQIHVLDPAMHPCPDWVTGEIYIGGTGVALGYWRDAERTRASFVRCPHGGERLYRTGDLGRVLPDGNVEFLGRRDAQVKVGGHRIELGEIEAALGAHPAVRAAVAATVASGRGEKRLAAWVVPSSDGESDAESDAEMAPLSPSELREFVEARLPAYMVPSSITPIAALPLSANGKLDRSALTAPPSAPAPYVAPRSRLEQELVALWQDELGCERLGLDDSFFDLGAESITLVRMQRRIALELGTEVSVVELFRHATIRALAARLRDGDAGVDLDEQRARGSRQREALRRRAGGARREQTVA
jgi:amino acid adenylation domain-containing protein